MLFAVKIAERINDCILVCNTQPSVSLQSIKQKYSECIHQMSLFSALPAYEEMKFDYSTANKCDLCLHHAEGDREFVTHLGRNYHPECANLWLNMGKKDLPVFTLMENSMY